jgi:hypothetical protein
MHIAYELQLVNQSALDVTIRRVEARTGGRAIGTAVSGRAVAAKLGLYGGASGATLRAGTGGMLFMDVAYPPSRRAPRVLQHVFSLSARAAGRRAQAIGFTGVPVPVTGRRSIEVAPPLRGGRWVVANGCCSDVNAHRAAALSIDGTIHVAERYAIDFVQLNAQDRLFEGPLERLTSYRYFGAPILSATDGRVVDVRDGLPEQTPGALPEGQTVQTAGGNHIVIDMGGGRWAFYAHLQPGSPRVRVGDRVRTGDVIGLLGNTGNTDGPHLHFHVMDSPSPLQSNGVPYTFTQFTGQGFVENVGPIQGGAVAQLDGALSGPHRDELPLDNQLVDFGG